MASTLGPHTARFANGLLPSPAPERLASPSPAPERLASPHRCPSAWRGRNRTPRTQRDRRRYLPVDRHREPFENGNRRPERTMLTPSGHRRNCPTIASCLRIPGCSRRQLAPAIFSERPGGDPRAPDHLGERSRLRLTLLAVAVLRPPQITITSSTSAQRFLAAEGNIGPAADPSGARRPPPAMGVHWSNQRGERVGTNRTQPQYTAAVRCTLPLLIAKSDGLPLDRDTSEPQHGARL